jgi:large subunit ribosomal protein L10
MNPDKKTIVAQLVQRLENAPYMLLVDYTGVTMPQFTTIRKRLREVNAKFHVTKNSYIKAVGTEKNYPVELQKDLAGQTAVVFGDKDVCSAAKVIAGANKEFQKPVLKSGVLDGQFLTASDVQGLADIGSRENLLAKLLGVLNAPAAALARVIAAKIEKDGTGAPAPEAPTAQAPAAEAPAAEAPAAEAPAAEAPAAEAPAAA